MKKTLKTAGALGLAAATIFTGLSFGQTAAVATEPEPSLPTSSALDPTRLVGKYVSMNRGAGYSNSFLAVPVPQSGTAPSGTGHATVEAALASAATFTFPALDDAGPVKSVNDPTLCLDTRAIPGYSGLSVRPCEEGVVISQLFSWSRVANTQVPYGYGLMPASNPNYLVGSNGTGRLILESPSYADAVFDARNFSAVHTLSGRVDSVDRGARTASVSGTAVPNAIVRINSRQEVVTAPDGSWSATVAGLAFGANTITLEQYENGTKTADASLTATVTMSPLAASTDFPQDRTKNAVASGTAHPGAAVVIRDAAGTEIARTTASTGSIGTWSVDIPAPNAGGGYPVTIHQEIDGEIYGEITRTVAYGAAVSITAPVEGMAHDGGPVSMRGTGEAGAQVTVREEGRTTVIGTTTVYADGNWDLNTTAVDARKHVLEATQTGKGNNSTTSLVTLNPEAFTRVTVTAPVSGTEFEPGTSVRFTGTGAPGGVVTLTPTNGAASRTTKVGSDGTWTIDRYLGNGAYTFDVTQVADGTTSSVNGIVLTPKQTAPIDKAFTVSSPTTGSAIKNQLAPFTGTGAAGTTIRLHTTNFTSADITTIVGNDGTWSVNKWIGDGPYVMDITQEGRVAGAIRGFQLNAVAAVATPTAGASTEVTTVGTDSVITY